MKLRDIVEFSKSVGEEYLDAEVLVDTEAAEYDVHMAEITDIDALDEDMGCGRKVISISLDDKVKIHRSAPADNGISIASAQLIGICSKCQEPSTGSFDSDREDDPVEMKCVSCGSVQNLGTKRG